MTRLYKILIPILFLFSCGNNKSSLVISNHALVNYFQTDDVEIRKQNNSFNVFVENSTLVNKERERRGLKWLTVEPFASFGALIFFNQIKDMPIVPDSINMNIVNGASIETYHYKVTDLKKIKRFSDTCSYFFKSISNKDYLGARKALGPHISNERNSEKLDIFFKLISSQGKVIRSELIAFTMDERLIGIYVNIYFDNNKAQTYICNFYKDGDGLIEGFSEPS